MGRGGALPFVVSGPQDWDWLSLHTPHHLTLEAAQGAPREPRRDSRGERSPWLPLEMKVP